MSNITNTLQNLFKHHRIVFWTDEKRELEAEFNDLMLPGVETIELNNNEFGVKYRVLRQEPEKKFLIYRAGPRPADSDNWLLDLELAYGEFRADQAGLWLAELGLSHEFMALVTEHEGFFNAASRLAALKEVLTATDTARQIRLKMLAVATETAAAGVEPRLDVVLERLLLDLANGRNERLSIIQRSALEPFLWAQVEQIYGYTSEAPSVQDFAIALFKSGYQRQLGHPADLNNDALVFLQRWKDNTRHQTEFRTLSAEYVNVLGIEADLRHRAAQELARVDLFELVDRKVLSDLAHSVAARTITADDVAQLIHSRRQGHWFDEYEDYYEAIGYAAHFLSTLSRLDLTMHTFADGLRQYSTLWYELDQLYRRFIYHQRQTGSGAILSALAEQMENQYETNFLLALNNRWQALVDAVDTWEAAPLLDQQQFYDRLVAPFLARGNKVAVIISDGLRYEAGEELQRRIRQEDRYEAELEAALTVLPSFTQLGMAALLPHETLAFAEDAKTILVDGQSSAGLANRIKILEQASGGKATAVTDEVLMSLDRDESRALFRDHDVVYVYHNRIDAVGDKRDSEQRTFEAVEETLAELIRIIKKLNGANIYNMLLTSDHGFIYQNRPLDESDFLGEAADRTAARHVNRRFVVGRNLTPSAGFKHFTAAQVGLGGEMDILIPKSINRLRVQGAGSRYVHGGAALQEVVIPILRINKKRESDIGQVDIDILRTGSTTITTSQVAITFFQVQPVTDKRQPRKVRAGFFTEGGELISDEHTLTFDLTNEEPRQRQLAPVRFILTRAADAAEGQEIILRLREQVGSTTHYQDYKTARYTLQRSFGGDDFFNT